MLERSNLITLLACQFFVLLISLLKIFQIEAFDSLYGGLIIALGCMVTFFPNKVNPFLGFLAKRFPSSTSIIRTYHLYILSIITLISLFGIYGASPILLLFLIPMAKFELTQRMATPQLLTIIQNKTLLTWLSLLSGILFLFAVVKTPGTLTEYHHLPYIADELQLHLTSMKPFSSYAAQYSNLLGPIFGKSFISRAPVELNHSTAWLLILLQYLAVVLLILLIWRIVRHSGYKVVSLIFTGIMAGGFYYGQGVLDWLQNFPSRTFFPICVLFIYWARISLDSHSAYLKYKFAHIWRNILDVVLGLTIALGTANDPIFGFPLLVAVIISSAIIYESDKGERFLSILIIVISFFGGLSWINNLFFKPSDFEKDIHLFLHYILQYGSNGFGEPFEYFGPDIVFWSFAIFAIFNARISKAVSVKDAKLVKLQFLTGLLILSTIPYCTGRSLTPQIWASCAIYLVLCFSTLWARVNVFFESKERIHIRMFLTFFAVAISFSSHLFSASNFSHDFSRLTSGSSDSVVLDQKISFLYSQLKVANKTYSWNPKRVGLMTSYGNNLSVTGDYQNVLMANDPTSITSAAQLGVRCAKLAQFDLQYLVIDKSLMTYFNSDEQCLNLDGVFLESDIFSNQSVALVSFPATKN